VSLTFPQSRRLQKANEFKRVWNKSKRITSKYITLVISENNLGHPRLGLSLSKKNIRHAVHRNRLKRVARETFRLKQVELDALDIIVIVYKGADKLSRHQQYEHFKTLWNQLVTRCKKFS
jgi:ribonuclease P protein component